MSLLFAVRSFDVLGRESNTSDSMLGCRDDTPCDVGEGDCDSDSQCKRDLVCGKNKSCMERIVEHAWAQCVLGKGVNGDGHHLYREANIGSFISYDECINACLAQQKVDASVSGCTMAVPATWDGLVACYAEHIMYSIDEGYPAYPAYKTCYLPKTPVSHLRCQGANDGCCTPATPCVVNDGDCDSNDECAGDLVCGNNNCAWGWDDCCMERTVA